MILKNSGDESMEMNEMMAAQMGGGAHHHHQFQHHHQSEREKSLKKGPWTAAEDAILMEYVKKHGEGNWNAVQKNSGLMRCGKSCRLRWANHLRPNLKKGSLTPAEERIIIELHPKYGNKWARMASQLPGRTDNEIKNYWNTRIKRRQRAGLPIYPHDLQHEAAAAFRRQQAQLQLQRRNNNTNTSAFASLLSSSHPRKPSYGSNPPLFSLYDQMSYDASTQQNHHDSRIYSNPAMTAPYNGNGGFASPLSPVSPFGSSSSALFSQASLPSQTLMTTLSQYYNSSHVGFGGSYNSPSLSLMLMGAPTYEPLKPELPSNQTSPYSPYTPVTPASFNGGESFIEAASGNTNDYEIETDTYLGKRSNGLLDDVLEQARTMPRTKRLRSDDSSSGESGKDKYVVEEDESANVGEEEDNVQDESTWKSSGDNSAEKNRDGSSSPSIGMKPSKDPLEEMAEDLLCLLNFSSATPVSADSWYMGGMSSRASSGMNGSAGGMNVSQDVQQCGSTMGSSVNESAAELDDEVKRSLPPCFWNNMPGMSGIC